MRKTLTYTAIAALFAVPAAMAGENMTFADIDTDADGALTLTEIQAVKPTMTAEKFAKYDTDADGAISEAEYDAWKESKMDKKEDKSDDMSDDSSY